MNSVMVAPGDPCRLNESFIIITGTCRSGKTTIGVLLGTCKSCYFYDEPTIAMWLPVLYDQGVVSKEFSSDLLTAELSELLPEILLLRKANFRPTDSSSILNQKEPDEIKEVFEMTTRDQVITQFLKLRGKIFLGLPEISSTPFLRDSLNMQCPMLEVYQDGKIVANHVAAKSWFSDETIRSSKMAYVRKKAKKSNNFVPWWLKSDDEDLFWEGDNFARGLLYWVSLVERSLSQNYNNSLLLNFQDFLKSPHRYIDAIAMNFEIQTTDMTLHQIDKLFVEDKPFEGTISSCLKERYEYLMDRLEEEKLKV
jgi:hypothetical protein